MDRIKQSGITIKKRISDNEALEKFLQTITKQGIEYQKVPPHIHQQNAAEKAINTFKQGLIKPFQCTHGTSYYCRQKVQ